MKKRPVHSVTGTVKQFPQLHGWVYLPIPQTYADLGFKERKPKWGLVPATITVGKTTWHRSLLPYGDGTLFIALPKAVRTKEDIAVGDTITATFVI